MNNAAIGAGGGMARVTDVYLIGVLHSIAAFAAVMIASDAPDIIVNIGPK